MTARGAWMVSAAVLSMVCGSARGQLVLPPKEAPPPTPAYVPPPPPPPAESKPLVRPGGRPVAPPDVKYESLVKRDDAGRLIYLNEPVVVAALRANPMIEADRWTAIQEHLDARNKQIADLSVHMADAVLLLEDGLLSNFSLTDPENLPKVTAILEPLKSVKSVLLRLRDSGTITPEELALTSKISQEYQAAVMGDIRAQYADEDASDPNKKSTPSASAVARWMFEQTTREMVDGFRALSLGAAAYFPAAIDAAPIPDDEKAAARARVGAIAAAGDDEARYAAILDVLRAVKPEHQALLASKAVELSKTAQ